MHKFCPCSYCPYQYFCSTQYSFMNALNSTRSEKGTKYNKRQKQFTTEELAQYDGSSGKPAYVAVNGIVYDASFNPAWGGGTHFGLYAGKDLTAQFQGCHDNDTILTKLPKVGVLI